MYILYTCILIVLICFILSEFSDESANDGNAKNGFVFRYGHHSHFDDVVILV